MNKNLLLIMLFGGLNCLQAQDHEPVFPDLNGTQLLTAVTDNFTPGSVLSYGEARDILFGTIDQRNDTLYCVYTDWSVYLPPGEDPTQAAFQNGQGINTEHTWPQSLGASQLPARADMHHLFPTRVDVNGDRGSLPFGDISDSSTDRWYYLAIETTNIPTSDRDNYSEYRQGVAFEPREVFKGNIARAMMYFYTIYRDEANAQGPNFFAGQQTTLCDWHAEDPVDATEWSRTLGIANYQDDKANPFVLDCTLAARLYCPEQLDDNCAAVSTRNFTAQPLTASIFPNPNRGGSQLSVECPAAGELQLRYYDSLGRLVQALAMQVSAGTNKLQLQLPRAGYWHCELQLLSEGQLYRQILPVVVTP